MTDRSKFEQMLEYLISEEQDKAKELFHQLVVEKSREIYETILAEDFEEVEEAKDEDDEEVEEAKDEDDEAVEEGMEVTFSETDDEKDEMEMAMGDDEVGGDATDDFMSDIEVGDDDGDMDSEEGLEDRVVDIEDALDELKAEFEKMMAGEEGEEHMDDEEGEEEGEDDEEEMKDSFDVSDNFMREYIEKVANPKHSDNGVNTKSTVAGKNNMGGTTANIAKGGEAKGEGTQGGLLNPSTKEENAGNINVPGGKAGNAFNKKEPGHGAEKKGAAETADNKKSTIGSK
jgi:hypothetical protein